MARVKREFVCLEGVCSTRSSLIFTLDCGDICMSNSVYSYTHSNLTSIAVYRDTVGVFAHGNDLLGSQFLKNACKIDSGFNSFIHLREKSEHSDQLDIFFPTSIIVVHLTRNASNV